MEVLQAKNLKKIYGSGNNAVHALDGVDLSVKQGEFVAIVGTSGSEMCIRDSCGGVSLILLDINLPDGSGLELLREVKENLPGIPVILLTRCV